MERRSAATRTCKRDTSEQADLLGGTDLPGGVDPKGVELVEEADLCEEADPYYGKVFPSSSYSPYPHFGVQVDYVLQELHGYAYLRDPETGIEVGYAFVGIMHRN